MTKAIVSFTLKQTKGKKVKKKAAEYPGESAKAIMQYWKQNPEDVPKRFVSALKVSPTKAAKKILKLRKQLRKENKNGKNSYDG